MKNPAAFLGAALLAVLMFFAPPPEWAGAQILCEIGDPDCGEPQTAIEICAHHLPSSPIAFVQCVVGLARNGELGR